MKRRAVYLLALLLAIQVSSGKGAPQVGDGSSPLAAAASAPRKKAEGRDKSTRETFPRCTPPNIETVSIPAEQVLKDLFEGKNVDLKGKVIDGNLDADLVWPPADDRRTALRVISGSFKLDSCRVAGRFVFRRCVFLEDLELPCTEIRGDFDLTDSDVRQSMSCPRLHVVGETRLGGLTTGGDLVLSGAVLGDRADLSGLRVHGKLALNDADIRRDVEVTKTVVSELDLHSTRVGGQAKLQDLLVLWNLVAHDSKYGRGLVIDTARVLGQADLSDAGGIGGLTISDLTVDQQMLFALDCPGPVSIADLRVGGGLSLFEGRFAGIVMDRVHVKGDSEFDSSHFTGGVLIRDADFGERFSAADAVFDGDCEFRRVRFSGRNPMGGALFAHAPVLIDTVLPLPPAVRSEAEQEDDEDPRFQDVENP